MAARALFVKDAPPQRHVRTVAGLRVPDHGHIVEPGGNVDPGLRFPQLLLHDDVAHGDAVALGAGKIRQLPHDVLEALPGQRRDGMIRIALGLESVAARAELPELRGAAIGMRIELQRRLGGSIHRFLGRAGIDAREREQGGKGHGDAGAPRAQSSHSHDHLDLRVDVQAFIFYDIDIKQIRDCSQVHEIL